ncbi:hypothetical protein A8950_2675 [Dongia mobilis]|uniref:Small secreted protein n=1 Tax=Dongia mobilis TaxID=578943 RepID=A0A4R6WQ98_9PROT|nr:hypothetical protein [Dongia mobilis]TDQ80808.1 hypothetical protein A8950_2675 [Dongia mobilis]
MQGSFVLLLVTLSLTLGTMTACKPGQPTPDAVREMRDGRVIGGHGQN